MSKKRKPSIFEGRLEKEDEGYAAEKEQFLELEEHSETPEEFATKASKGEKDITVDTFEGREELVESDEIAQWEEGFAEGAKARGEFGSCAHCGAVLSQDRTKIVEREIDHEIKFFCSNACAEKCLAKHKAI